MPATSINEPGAVAKKAGVPVNVMDKGVCTGMPAGPDVKFKVAVTGSEDSLVESVIE